MKNSKYHAFRWGFEIFIHYTTYLCIVVHLSENGKNFLAYRYVWESKADGAFAISEDTWNEPLGRGTEIRLHLREEAGEYLEESKLKVRVVNVVY